VYKRQDPSGQDYGGLARVRAVRKQLEQQGQEVLMLHAGDFLHPSFNSRLYNGLSMVNVLSQLDGDAEAFDDNMVAVFGNHEFDQDKLSEAPLLQQAIDQSQFYWLDTNIHWRDNSIQSDKFQHSILRQINGITIGFFGVTTDVKHPEYIDRFDTSDDTAKRYVPQLRAAGADVVVALTHQWLPADQALLNLPEAYRPDLIIGGHENTLQVDVINNNWIIKADANAKNMVAVTVMKDSDGNIDIAPSIIELHTDLEKDAALDSVIQAWDQKAEMEFCKRKSLPADCLAKSYGSTQVDLIAEEDKFLSLIHI